MQLVYQQGVADLTLCTRMQFVKIFPLWFAPNAITLMGFFFILTSCFLSWLYCPQLNIPSPRSIYFLHGILLFLYQTFDAVDGKQARRTSSSSPLGELFDHGCDALTCGFESLVLASTAMAGAGWRLLWMWLLASIPFFFATWEHYYTHSLVLSEVNGPTEGLLMIYVIHMLTAFTGAEAWGRDFFTLIGVRHVFPNLPFLQIKDFVLLLNTFGAALPTLIQNFTNVSRAMRHQKKSMLLPMAMLGPFISLVAMTAAWIQLSPTNIFGRQPHLFIIATGFSFGLLVGRVILAHLCDEPKGLKTNMSMGLTFLPLAIANALSAQMLGGTPMVKEVYVLVAYFVFTFFLYAHFAIGVIREITDALHIRCFSIKKTA
eukprot:jgi/Chlat1/4879/Chrsp31S04814